MADSISETAVTEIRAELGRQRLTLTAFAARLGWSYGFVQRRMNGPTDMTLSELEQIAAVLGRPLADFLTPPARPAAAAS